MEQINVDVAIVGGGGSGMVAAVTAAEGGASVIVFEKAAHVGGTTVMAAGPFAVESRLQRLNQNTFGREEAFKYHMEFTHWRVDARLVKAFIDKSGSTIDWLEDMGVRFFEPDVYTTGGKLVWHRIVGRGAKLIKTLTDRAKELGVNIYLETPVKKVLKEGGQIVGVVGEDKSGKTVQANAKAVIIGTGGFGDNPEWIKKYFGYEWGHDFYSIRIPGLVGDGIRMAWEVGAAESEMNMVWNSGMPPGFGGALDITTQTFRQPNLMVNLMGERFMNEDMGRNGVFIGNAIALQKNRCAFMILDEAAWRYYEEEGLDYYSPGTPMPRTGTIVPKPIDFYKDIKKALDNGYEHIFMVDSLEELCAQTGIDLSGLRKTVEEYNKACDTGRDGLFYKNPKHLKPIRQPKFYAARFYYSGAYGSVGGIKINYKTEVLTKEYKVIPGLYAVGVDANSMYGGTYPYTLAGNLLGFALSSGRIAGENALEYIGSV